MTEQQATPPGWYPNGPGLERWWDGRQWGPQTRAVPATPRKAVAYVPHQTHPLFHLVMTVITCGLWLPVWLVVAIVQSITKRRVVTRYR